MSYDKKKIGIITFHNAHNYGAMLQVFALQKVIMEKYDTKIIDYRNEGIEKKYKITRINKKNIFTRIKSIIATIVFYRKNKKRYQKFDRFLKENLNLTQRYNSEEELKRNPPKLDVYITGSDQVWNYEISAKKIDAYTLNFGKEEIKKISYAASIGKNTFDEEYKKYYKNNIEKLDAISVREEEAKKYLASMIKKDIQIVLDPTFLIEKDKWEELFDLENKEKEKYIFAYILTEDPEYYKTINYLSKKTGLKVIHVSKKNRGIKNILRNAYSDGPIEFLRLIKNAEYIVATSFHATVFSIIFNKKIWVIPPKDTSSRITDLLDKLNISGRAFNKFEEFIYKDYDEEIDYKEVNKKLKEERKKSLNWLENAIGSKI